MPPLDRALVATFLRPDKVGPDRAGPLSAALWTATGGLRCTGSGSLELAWVAAGRLDAWVQPDPDPWDWLPGSLLVEAAGGTTAVVGDGPAWHVAGPPALVDELAALLSPSLAGGRGPAPSAAAARAGGPGGDEQRRRHEHHERLHAHAVADTGRSRRTRSSRGTAAR